VSFLVDTNVLSEARRPRGHPRVKQWLTAAAPDRLFLSVLVLSELRRGVESLRPRDPSRATALDLWLSTLAGAFGDRLLPVSPEVADDWGRLNAVRPLPVIDALLAATARVHGLTLVTRNTADLAGVDVDLLDPTA